MQLAVVLVHYHSPELARDACEALQRDATASGIELEMVLVDNGSRPEDRGLLEALPARRLTPSSNLGYAGGANLGVRETSAEHIVVMNPDVEVLSGCLGELVRALENGAAAAGPRFFWDRDKRYLLPPTEAISHSAELLAVLARHSIRWAHLARRRWRSHARRYWEADSPFVGYDLSGALLAFRRDAWQSVGAFDEGYRLYYEETDWLQRLRGKRLKACYVPSAEAVHLYAQSTVNEPKVEAWRLDSSRRFRRRVYGSVFTRVLEGLSSRVAPDRDSAPFLPSHRTSSTSLWLEVSPSPLGFPAAGHRLSPDSGVPTGLPEEIRARLAPGTYYLRSIDREGRELGMSSFESPK